MVQQRRDGGHLGGHLHNQGVFARPLPGRGCPDASVTVVVAGTNNPGGGSYEDHHFARDLRGSRHRGRGYRVPGLPGDPSTFPMPAASLSVVNTVIVTTAVHDLFGPGQVGLIDPDYPGPAGVLACADRCPHETHMNNEPAVHVDLDDDPNGRHAFLDFSVFPGTPCATRCRKEWCGGSYPRPTATAGTCWCPILSGRLGELPVQL